MVQDVWIAALLPDSVREAVRTNARLQGLYDELTEVATGVAAPRTITRYIAPWKQWLEFCDELGGLEPIPAPALELCLFLLDVGRRSASESNVKAAKSAVAFFHKLAGHTSPNKQFMVKATWDALRRKLSSSEHRVQVMAAGKRVGKAAVLSEMQLWSVADVAARHSRLEWRQTWVVFISSIGGFLRCDEVLALLIGDVIDLDHADFGNQQRKSLLVFVEIAKTDQYREGAWIPLPYGAPAARPTPHQLDGASPLVRMAAAIGATAAGTGSQATMADSISPGLWLRRFMLSERLHADPMEPVFGKIESKKGAQSIRAGTTLTYSRYSELLKEIVKAAGLPDGLQVRPHSGRATGATLAAERGVPDRQFKRHGRWCSDRAKDGYVRASLKQMLEVPEALAL